MLNRRPRRLMNQMNVVPYIDVMLVLLVIFMVTAPMFTPGVIEVPSVAEANPMQQNNTEPVYLEIKSPDDISYRDGKQSDSLTQDGLIEWAQQFQDTDRPIVVSADKNMSYNDVISIVSKLHEAKIKRVALVTQEEKGK